MSFLKATMTVGSFTHMSRILGFTRDILTAALLGAGPIADAFFVALKLPNFFRRISAEGAFGVSFIPLFSKTLKSEGKKEAEHFANLSMGFMLAVLIPFVILALIFMPEIIRLIAPGFEPGGVDGRFDMAVEMTRITFAYILCMSLVALFGGVLNSFDRFAPFAAAPIIFNLCLITALLVGGEYTPTVGHAMSWGVTIAGVLQFLIIGYYARKTGIALRPLWPRLTAKIKKLFSLMGPGIIGAGVVQINLLVDVILASFLPAGAVSYLYYGDRLAQLPLGIIGIAIGTALLPKLSKALENKKSKSQNETKSLINLAFVWGGLLALPACFALIAVPDLLSTALFQRGSFDEVAALATAGTIRAYALGLPAYIAIKILSTQFYAREDTATPVKIAIISATTNIILSIILIQYMAHVGIALATSIAATLQALILYTLSRKRGHADITRTTTVLLFRVIIVSLVMAAVIFTLKIWGYPYWVNGGWSSVITMLAIVTIGKITYSSLIIITKTMTISDCRSMLKTTMKT